MRASARHSVPAVPHFGARWASDRERSGHEDRVAVRLVPEGDEQVVESAVLAQHGRSLAARLGEAALVVQHARTVSVVRHLATDDAFDQMQAAPRSARMDGHADPKPGEICGHDRRQRHPRHARHPRLDVRTAPRRTSSCGAGAHARMIPNRVAEVTNRPPKPSLDSQICELDARPWWVSGAEFYCSQHLLDGSLRRRKGSHALVLGDRVSIDRSVLVRERLQ